MNSQDAILSQLNLRAFRTNGGEALGDLRTFVRDWLSTHPGGEVYVGTDSQTRGNRVKYSTVVCLWDVGHGVWEAYANTTVPRPKDRFTRLWHELQRSVAVAELLSDIGRLVTIHMDFNSDPSFPSYQLYDAGMGWVRSMGFQAAGKPYSWAASSGANKRCQ